MDLWKAALGFEGRIRRAPTPIRPARRAAARGSQFGGNPEPRFAVHSVIARGDKTAEHERDAGFVADTGDLCHPELGTSEFAFCRILYPQGRGRARPHSR